MRWSDITRLANQGNVAPLRRVVKTESEWQSLLSAEQFYVTRRHGTERPWSGAYCEAHEPGLYACVCCGSELFDSRQKFDSGTGWPSFTQPVDARAIKYLADDTFGMRRVEVQCNVCDAHLGHVFPDGPQPSGLRFCINSLSLRLVDNPPQPAGS